MKVREGLEDLIDVLLTQAGTRGYNTYLPLFTCIVCIFYIIYFYDILYYIYFYNIIYIIYIVNSCNI